MKADTPSLASVKEAQNFKEYLGTIGGGTDVILKNGMLYDEDIFFDDPLPANHPIVQEVLRTKEGQTFLSGYGNAELIGTEEDETPVVVEPVVEPVRTPAPQVTQPAFPSINRRESDFIPRPF